MTQHRVILFCHDATGLGHLRRISRIASFLQGPFACLVITGMAEVQWMVQPPCEFIKIPNWDCLSKVRALRKGRSAWLNIPIEQSLNFRAELISAIGRAFQPSAVLVDYLPYGLRDELRPFLTSHSARKYLIHRGIVDFADRSVLHGIASEDFGSIYDRIVVMADKRIIDVASEYQFEDEAKYKTVYVGYVNPAQLPSSSNEELPADKDTPIVVCACGGGLGGEAVFLACIRAATELKSYLFHVILGPHGTLPPASTTAIPDNCRVYQICEDLHLLHKSASLVITHGGYNSVTEAISGGARILVWHIQGGDQDERLTFESRLSSLYPIMSVSPDDDFVKIVRSEVELALSSDRPDIPLDFNGLSGIKSLLEMDLGIFENSTYSV